MYELARVRLYSVGPKAARYQDVTLDLRDVGPAVQQPVQDSLFGADPTGGTLRRPSPASVLFTENGNGKSVLIKLIFSVMLPGLKQVVGTKNSKALGDFVLAHDVAQVALEWQHTKTGQRVVTGKVSAWKNHVVSADTSRLQQAWYSFKPTDTVNLDALPFTEDNRLVSLSGFRDRMGKAAESEPEIEWVWEAKSQQDWTSHLDRLGLDSELFAYQRKMNEGEGEAAGAFQFKTDEAFVNWLLTVITDPQDLTDLADVVDGYVQQLSKRADLQLEHDFIEGALERLTPLVAAGNTRDIAELRDTEATRSVQRFAESVTVRINRDTTRLESLSALLAEKTEEDQVADRVHRRLGRVVLELQRLTRVLQRDAAVANYDAIKKQADKVRGRIAAWEVTPTLLAFRKAHADAESVRAVVKETEQNAAAALDARNQAATRLVRGLLALADAAEAAADEAEQRGEQIGTDAEVEEARDREQGIVAASKHHEAERLRAEVSTIQQAVDDAISDGLITSAADLADAVEVAQNNVAALKRRLDDGESEQQALVGKRNGNTRLLQDATSAASERKHDLEQAQADQHRAEDVTSALAAEPRLLDLMATDTVLLDSDARPLLERLADAVTVAETTLTRLRMEQERDSAILDALGTGGLLPPPQDVLALKDVLTKAGITAYAGWEYLSQMPEDERAAAIAEHPALVGGIALNSPHDLDLAHRALEEARLLPTSLVAVGTTGGFSQSAATSNDDVAFVVEPNPALYDDDLAEIERERLARHQETRTSEIQRLTEQVKADNTLINRVESWLNTYPPGTLTRLADEVTVAAERHHQAEAKVAELTEVAEKIAAAEEALTQELPQLRAAHFAAKETAARLATVHDEARRLPELNQTISQARDAERAATQAAEAARQKAKDLREDQRAEQRHADQNRSEATQYRDEVGIIAGANPDASAPAPEESVQVLRDTYRSAAATYERQSVGADLENDLRNAENTEAAARADLEQIPTPLREAAEALLSSTDGQSVAARAAALGREQRTLSTLAVREQRASSEVTRQNTLLEGMEPQEVSLDGYGRPSTVADGEVLIAGAQGDYNAAAAKSRAVAEELAAMTKTVDELQGSLGHLQGVLDTVAPSPLADVAEDREPFAGDVEQARSHSKDLRRRQEDARKSLADAQSEVRDLSEALHDYAADDTFAMAENTARRDILSVGVGGLVDHAGGWESLLRPRLRTLADDLANLNRHRNNLIAQLRGMVTTALQKLRTAERVSTLPESLGDWAGQKFLRIRFVDIDHASLDDRLGTVIDDAVTTGDSSGKKRDGMTLLQRGVKAAMPRGVTVDLLKPDSTIRTERVRIADVNDVFSGGQELTAAIILYCTMAALRANEKGRARNQHAGVLFLDNPIGRANANYLLDLQIGVAEKLGVQLIYTTGLFDTNALAVFPLIIRIRNDRDVRSGMKYLTVAEEIKRHLDTLGKPDGTGHITTARLFRKPTADPTPVA